MKNFLEFEKDLIELQGRLAELEALSKTSDSKNIKKEINDLHKKSEKVLKDLYDNLSPWKKCQVARHPDRPHSLEYINALIKEFTPLSGDRNFAEDLAIVGGIGRLKDIPIVVIGHEKGNSTENRLKRNFLYFDTFRASLEKLPFGELTILIFFIFFTNGA